MGLIKIMVPGVHAPVNNVAATPQRKLYRRVFFQILSLAPSLMYFMVLVVYLENTVFHWIGMLVL